MSLLKWISRVFRRDGPVVDGEASEPSSTVTSDDRSVRSVPRRITIGIDFGTSSTKVAFQDAATDRTAHVVDFDVGLPGYTRFSRPSLVGVHDGELLLGEKAASAAIGREDPSIVRSPKIELLARHVDSDILDVAWSLPDALTEGDVSILEGMVTLFLADTIRRALRGVASVYPDAEPSTLAFNLDVPVSGLDDDRVARRFQRMLDVAIPLAVDLEEGMVAREALDLWIEHLHQVLEDPPVEGERPGELVPEAEAIIQGVGSALDARSSDLYHAIVDIGAGTTDVGWFKLVVARSEDRLPFFAAGTEQVGCDQVDARLVERVVGAAGSVQPALRSQVVQIKPDLISGDASTLHVDGRDVNVRPEDLEEAAERVVPAIQGHYSKTFEPAYEKEKNTDRWERLRVVVVGGGSLVPALRRPFEDHPRKFGTDVELVDISTEMKLRAAGASNRPPTREEKPFLTAALGLSYPMAVMPRVIMPSDIDDDPGGSEGPTGVYDYPPVDY